ncbi:MAG: LamG domain-containing protein [Candidatus Omnitrophota bacterium]
MTRYTMLIVFAAMLSCPVLFAGTPEGLTFYASFNQTVDADFSVAKTTCNSPAQLTDENKGISGKGALVCWDNLEDFADVKARDSQPRQVRELEFANAGVFNPEAGTVEMWIKPYFNGILPTQEGSYEIYYLLNVRNSKISGKGGLAFAIYRAVSGTQRYITVNFNVDGNDEQPPSSCCFEVSNWKAKEWHHIAFTWDAAQKVLYLDGGKKAELKIPGKILAQQPEFQLGCSWSSTSIFQGVIDEVKIYDRVMYHDTFSPKQEKQ